MSGNASVCVGERCEAYGMSVVAITIPIYGDDVQDIVTS